MADLPLRRCPIYHRRVAVYLLLHVATNKLGSGLFAMKRHYSISKIKNITLYTKFIVVRLTDTVN